MKTFKLIGPETERVIEIEDDEMLVWRVQKIEEYEEEHATLDVL